MNDPAFLFYPGDYLRDTQCLSEKSQVAYDRIMCEHMRNICISQQQLNFFTKRLSDDEKNELLFLLSKNENGFQIKWVSESIEKRKKYSDSRRENRLNKGEEKPKDMLTYDSHMDNENENENINKNIDEIYTLYPSKCLISNRSLGKSFKDKEKIKKHLLSGIDLKFIIERYQDECVQSKVYMKNFATFLNNLPDYSELPKEEKPKFEEMVSFSQLRKK
jgi:hypothetical protein